MVFEKNAIARRGANMLVLCCDLGVCMTEAIALPWTLSSLCGSPNRWVWSGQVRGSVLRQLEDHVVDSLMIPAWNVVSVTKAEIVRRLTNQLMIK